MSDLTKKPPAHYAPVYAAAMYPELAEIARGHGYALAVHGSLARDFDLIAVPWVESPGTPQDVLDEILSRFAVKLLGPGKPMPHGRIAFTLSVGFAECAVDLQFTPTSKATA